MIAFAALAVGRRRLQLPPEAGAGLLAHRQPAIPGRPMAHQGVPVAAAPAPAPLATEGIQGQPTTAAAGAGEHGGAPQQRRHPLAEGLGAGPMAPQQGDREAPQRIHHHHGRIAPLVLQ